MDVNYILSQVFVVIYFTVSAFSYLAKSHRTVLIYQIVLISLLNVSYFFLSAWTGFALGFVSILRVLIYMWLAKKNPSDKRNKLDWTVLILFIILGVVTTAFTWEGFHSIFALIECSLFAYVTWQKNVKVYRFLGIVISITDILYNVFIHSIMAIILNSVVLLVNIINIIRVYGFNKKEIEKKEGNETEEVTTTEE